MALRVRRRPHGQQGQGRHADARAHPEFLGETYFEWFGTVRAVGGYEFAPGWSTYQYRLLRRMSASLEYLYFGFEEKPFRRSGELVIGDNDVPVNPQVHMLRLGLNFHF